jgi:hypothetical protein
MEIATGGKFKSLVIRGFASLSDCVDAWEEILRKNSLNTGTLEYDSYRQLLQGYWLLVAEHTIVKANLLKLTTVIDWECIQEVRSRGYKIDVGRNYVTSLNRALRRVENLVTKARMKEQEIARMMEGSVPEQQATFDTVMARLVDALGFQVGDNLTLARFNEYKKIIQERNKHRQLRHEHGRI